MIINQTNYKNDLRKVFCGAVIKVFGGTVAFLYFLESERYSTKYDCYIDYNGENYIINTETGEYINWYKFDHVGRAINISTFPFRDDISKWFDNFLTEFKESGVENG